MILPLAPPLIKMFAILSEPLSFKSDSSARPPQVRCRNNGTIITLLTHWRGLSLELEYGLMTVLVLFS